MAQQTPIQTLIEIAEKNSDDAAKQLGRMISVHAETEKKLNLLIQYRDDYVLKFQTNAQRGLSAAQYMNYQQFIGKLEEAITGQKVVVEDAKLRIDAARVNWQNQEKKRLSYDTLHDRAVAAETSRQAKQDQKNLDEQAARLYFYKQ
jgi:flagellar FliJ protein